MAENTGRALDWGDSIDANADDHFVIIPAGEYPFTVKSFARGRFDGSAKLPPCNMAKLEIEIDGGEHGSTTVNHNLYLHSVTMGLLCAFFKSIGARAEGETIVMDWGKVPGSSGICKVSIRDWQGKDGETRQSNQIKSFLPPLPGGDTPF